MIYFDFCSTNDNSFNTKVKKIQEITHWKMFRVLEMFVPFSVLSVKNVVQVYAKLSTATI